MFHSRIMYEHAVGSGVDCQFVYVCVQGEKGKCTNIPFLPLTGPRCGRGGIGTASDGVHSWWCLHDWWRHSVPPHQAHGPWCSGSRHTVPSFIAWLVWEYAQVVCLCCFLHNCSYQIVFLKDSVKLIVVCVHAVLTFSGFKKHYNKASTIHAGVTDFCGNISPQGSWPVVWVRLMLQATWA